MQVFVVGNAKRQQAADYHQHASQHHYVERVEAGELLHNERQAQGGTHLRQHDKGVENAHEVPHLVGWNGAGQHGVGHREDTRPGHAHAYHADVQHPGLGNKGDGNKAQAAGHEAEHVRHFAAEPAGYGR